MSTESSIRGQAPGPLVLLRDFLPRSPDCLSLYLHVPFCESRCRYCNFYFETGWSPRVLHRTLEAILEESRLFRQLLYPGNGPTPLRTIYVGGGTPSVIPPAELDRFFQALRGIWQPDPAGLVEFAVEANPESLKDGHLETFRRHGVTRLSLGVQTWNDRHLSLLGRRARAADIDRCLTLLDPRRPDPAWQGLVNLDLMVGLPGQTRAELDADLDRLLGFQPPHVSVYTLTVEERTPLHRLLADPAVPELDDEAAEELWLHAAGRLEQAGLMNYEVSNFACPGAESRHNLAYWHLDPYLGLGPGAVSTLPCQPGLGREPTGLAGPAWIRLTNPDTFAYSRPGRPGCQPATEVLPPRDLLLEHFLTGLRIREGLDLGLAEGRCGLQPGTLGQALVPLLADWVPRGMALPLAQQRLILTKAGRMILNLLLEDLYDLVDQLFAPRQDTK